MICSLWSMHLHYHNWSNNAINPKTAFTSNSTKSKAVQLDLWEKNGKKSKSREYLDTFWCISKWRICEVSLVGKYQQIFVYYFRQNNTHFGRAAMAAIETVQRWWISTVNVSAQRRHKEGCGVSNPAVSIIYSNLCSGADQRRHKAPGHRPLWGEFTGDRWIPT